MDGWAWLLVYLAGFALLQVALYRYLRNSRGGHTAPAGVDGEGLRAPVDRADREDRRGEGRRCPHCGAHNGGDYTYCRNCVAQL